MGESIVRMADRDPTLNRFEVWQDSFGFWCVYCEREWPREDDYREFPTHDEAIAYADRMARTTNGAGE